MPGGCGAFCHAVESGEKIQEEGGSRGDGRDGNNGGGVGPPSAGGAEPRVPPYALSCEAPPFVPSRVLKAHSSRERSPRREAGGAASSSSPPSTTFPAAPAAVGKFQVNQEVKFIGLVSRPDLVGVLASVLSFEVASGRYAVMVDSTKKNVLVKEANITLQVFGPLTS